MREVLRNFTLNYSLKFAVFLGLFFGVGYLFGVILTERPELNQINLNEKPETLADLEKSQKKLYAELGYFDKLHKAPKVVRAQKIPQTAKIEIIKSSEALKLTEIKSESLEKAVEDNKPVTAQENLSERLAKVLGSSTPDLVKNNIKINKKLPSTTGSAYAIQLASFKQMGQAEVLLQELKSRGHKANIVQGELDNDRTVYRVRIHGFLNKDQAIDYLAKNQGNDRKFDFGFVIAQ